MIEWQYVTIGAFALAVGGVVGWYIALRKRFKTETGKQNLLLKSVSVFLIILAIGSVGQNYYFQREQQIQADNLQKVTDCQYRVNKTLLEVLTIRQDPTREKDEALVGMVQKVLTSKSVEDTRKALEDFVKAVDELNKTRTTNPYPTIPTDCRP